MNRAGSVHSPRGECGFAALSDDALVARVTTLAGNERRATTALIAALGEFDRRKLYLSQGCSSLFTYCTQLLHLSEHAAFNRIEAARAASRFPAVLDALEQGGVTLTGIRILAPVLTPKNHMQLLAHAKYKSKRDVELLAATERPRPDVPDRVRREPPATSLPVSPSRTSVGEPTSLAVKTTVPRQTITASTAPLTPERYRIQFTASKSFEEKLRRAQALLRHSIPYGEIEAVIERALDLLLASLEKRKWGSTSRSRPPTGADGASHTRHIPAAVKREVWKRDGGRCAFVGTQGRCTEAAFLEFHHVIPFADGGAPTTTNIELRCRSHNAYEAAQHFGVLPLDDS